MLHLSELPRRASVTGPWLRRSRIGSGQTMVEFAMVSVLALVVMIVGVQFAMIGQAALALSQGASAIARYAAVNESTLGASYGPANPNGAMQALLSPTINDTNLTVTISSIKGGTPSTTTTTPQTSTDRAVVTLSYNVANKIFLPSSTLLGITFPTILSASDQELYE